MWDLYIFTCVFIHIHHTLHRTTVVPLYLFVFFKLYLRIRITFILSYYIISSRKSFQSGWVTAGGQIEEGKFSSTANLQTWETPEQDEMNIIIRSVSVLQQSLFCWKSAKTTTTPSPLDPSPSVKMKIITVVCLSQVCMKDDGSC